MAACGFGLLASTGLLAATVVRGPYLQSTTTDGITIRWRTNVATDSRVLCGPAPGALAPCADDPAVTTEHAVALDGLAPGTRYHYAIGSSAETLAGDDATHYFETHPLPGSVRPIRIWVLGDSGYASLAQQQVRDAYYAFAGKQHTDLWIHVGDVSQTSGLDSQYQAELFDFYPDLLRRTPFWPTLGNHDGANASSTTESGPYYENFSLPADGRSGGVASETEAYYAFDFANVHFVVLNSFDVVRYPSHAMWQWLAADLADNSQDWLVAIWHHPPYSKGSHDSDTETAMVEMRTHVLPLLESHGVDLVLSGHSHSYERSYFLDGQYGPSADVGVCDPNGTPDPGDDLCAGSGTPCPGGPVDCDSGGYLVDGGDGRIDGDGPYTKPLLGPQSHAGAVYAVAGSGGSLGGGPLDHPVMFVSLNVLGSLVLDLDGARLDARFLDAEGTIRDEFTILKGTACPAGPYVDADGDGVCDDLDNCPGAPNASQADGDGDGLGNACDPCPADAQDDADDDGHCANVDNCPQHANPSQLDTDGDGAGDACDDDDDGDLVPDASDCAPLIVGVSAVPGEVRWVEMDRFGGGRLLWTRAEQGHTTNVYRGRIVAGELQSDSCVVAETPMLEQRDPDMPPPGVVFVYAVAAANVCGEGSLGLGPGGVERVAPATCAPVDDDFDFDLVLDKADNCAVFPNAVQADADHDFVGNQCDNCTSIRNPEQTDCDTDGVGDQCDASSDCDADGIGNMADNCLFAANADQADLDLDDLGDACDADDDGDGEPDATDCLPQGGSVATSPPAIGDSLRFAREIETTLSWVPSVQGHTTNVYRGAWAVDDPWVYDFTCRNASLPASEIAVAEDPPPGTLHVFLVAARNGCGESQAGSSSAGEGIPLADACAPSAADGDGDGVPDEYDNCPLVPNAGQADADGDFLGDACDPS